VFLNAAGMFLQAASDALETYAYEDQENVPGVPKFVDNNNYLLGSMGLEAGGYFFEGMAKKQLGKRTKASIINATSRSYMRSSLDAIGPAYPSSFVPRASLLKAAANTTELRYWSTAAKYLGRAGAIGTTMWVTPAIIGTIYHGVKGINKLATQLARPDFGGRHALTSMAATDRQRSIQALHNAEYNGRSAIGNEAAIYHQ
jgi:hypothetical protein